MNLPTLLIDVGNTRVKCALFVNNAVQHQNSLLHQDLSTFLTLVQNLPPIEGVWGCNVAGAQVAATIEEALAAIEKSVSWAKVQRQCAGVTTHYTNLEQLGPDRWLSVLAAHSKFSESVLVVNAGTALTVDCVTAQGDYLGGTISPGWRLMRDALAQHTARLGRPDGDWQNFPANTANAIITGVLNSLVGAIEQQAKQLQAKAGSVSYCLLSGGDAELLAPYLSMPVVRVENLVLEGLGVLGSHRA